MGDDDLPFAQEFIGHADSFAQQSAGILAQVQNEALEVLHARGAYRRADDSADSRRSRRASRSSHCAPVVAIQEGQCQACPTGFSLVTYFERNGFVRDVLDPGYERRPEATSDGFLVFTLRDRR